MKKISLLILTVVFIFSSVVTALAVDVTWNGFIRYQFVRMTSFGSDVARWRIADYRDSGAWKDTWFLWDAGKRQPDVWGDSFVVPLWRGNHMDGTTNDTWLDFKMNAAFSDNTSIMFKFWTKSTNDSSWHEGAGGINNSTEAPTVKLGTVNIKTYLDPVDVQIGGIQDEFGVSSAYNYPVIGKFEYYGVKLGIPVGKMNATIGVGTNDNGWIGETATGGDSQIGTASLTGEMSGVKMGAFIMSAAPNYRKINALDMKPRTFRTGITGSSTVGGVGLEGILAYSDNGSGVIDPTWDSWMQGYKQVVLSVSANYTIDPLTLTVFGEPTSRTTRDDKPNMGWGGPGANETQREVYRPGETYTKLLAGLDLDYKVSEKVNAGVRYDWGDNDTSVKKGTQVVMWNRANTIAPGVTYKDKIAFPCDDIFSRVTGRVKWSFDGVNLTLQAARTNYPVDLNKMYNNPGWGETVTKESIEKQKDELRLMIDTTF